MTFFQTRPPQSHACKTHLGPKMKGPKWNQFQKSKANTFRSASRSWRDPGQIERYKQHRLFAIPEQRSDNVINDCLLAGISHGIIPDKAHCVVKTRPDVRNGNGVSTEQLDAKRKFGSSKHIYILVIGNVDITFSAQTINYDILDISSFIFFYK